MPTFKQLEATPIYDELKWDFDFFRRECVHGLSEWLCEDPIFHYPPDNGFNF